MQSGAVKLSAGNLRNR